MSNIKCDYCGEHKPNDAVSNEVTKRALPVTYSYADMKTDALEKELTDVFNRHNVDTALGMHDYVIADSGYGDELPHYHQQRQHS